MVGHSSKLGSDDTIVEKASVLITGDDGTDVAAIVSGLSHQGFPVKFFNYSNLAKALSTQSPSAIIVDAVLEKGKNQGIEAFQQLNEQGGIDCPVIFICSCRDLGAYVTAVCAGADAYLFKACKCF